MKVFVTGATGFVGEAVAKKLHAAGHSLRILAREPGSARVQGMVSSYRAEVHRGDVTDAQSLRGGLEGIDAVIHLVGIISESRRSTFEIVHVNGTRNIVNAARQAGVKRLNHMSALGVRANAEARYHRTKWEAEEIVRGAGIDFTIFRPSIIYGPGDAFVNLFARMLRYSPVLPVIGDGRAKLQPIPVIDVATCFTAALGKKETIGQTYDLCGQDVLAFETVLDVVMEVTGRKRVKLHLPLALARMQAAMLEFILGRVLGKAPPLNRDQIIMLGEDNVGNAQAANDEFGLRPIAFRDGIFAYLEQRG